MKNIASLFFTFLMIGLPVFASTEYSIRHYDNNDGLSHWRTSGILQDTTGMIWIATWNGLNRFDGTNFVTFKAVDCAGVTLPCDRIRRLKLIDGYQILCLVEDRVIRFDTRTCRFDTLTQEQEAIYYDEMRFSLRSSYDITPTKSHSVILGSQTLSGIRADYTDHQGNSWYLDENGLYVATPIAELGTYVNHLEARYVHRMNNGDIWFCERDTRRVLVYDSVFHLRGYLGRDLQLHREPTTFAPVYCICEHEEHTYLGCKPGNMLEIYKGQLKSYDNTPNVYDIVCDRQGRVWMASFVHGLLVLQDDIVRSATVPMFARRLMLRGEKMYVATTNGLLVIDNIYAPTIRIRCHERDAMRKSSLSSNAVMNLCYLDSTLFVATEGGGLNVLQGDSTFQHITTVNGLGSDIVFEFLPLNDTTLLIQGNSYLATLNTHTYHLTNYDRSFFHRTLIFGEVPILRQGHNQLLLALKDGLFALPTDFLAETSDPVRIALSSIRRSQDQVDMAVDNTHSIKLLKDERSIEVHFSALDYRNDRHILYTTRLYERGEKPTEWGAPTPNNEVSLQDLRPGHYVLEIRSTNAYGHWQDNTRTLMIDVTPTFLESNIGRTIVILLLLILVVYTTIRAQSYHLLRRKRQKTLRAYFELQERYNSLNSSLSSLRQDTEPQKNVFAIPDISGPAIPSKDEQFLEQVRQFMERNMDNSEIVIDDLAAATNMSRSTLNRKMHELFNLSAKDFLQEARVKHACQLLRTTDLAAKEVAYACGFSDPRYFAKCFKASVGKTPTEYRVTGKDQC